MTRKSKGPESTVFRCCAPDARAVFVAGTFNQWSADATPMAKNVDGNWSAAVDLKPGRYEFKYVVDGVWCCEPGGDEPQPGQAGFVPNSFGTMNRVIEVD
ncbi:MAG: glycogen-binding domain-containing protein [Pirellulales bacterium]|nr:glycogen-binding domain-containing protein [Pirellulales bacterium]